jgi:hypothetical protein
MPQPNQEVQTAVHDQRSAPMLRLDVEIRNTHVSWKRPFSGQGYRAMRVDTFPGGEWADFKVTEMHDPNVNGKTDGKLSVKETYICLNRASAQELRDLLTIMLDHSQDWRPNKD